MKQKWKQVLAAFLLGAVMPGMALRLGQAMAPASTAVPTQPSQSVEEVTLPSTQPVQPAAMQIPVTMADGTVEQMPLETYILGVVLAEMPAEFELEALKAQAVAARTWTLQCVQLGIKHPGGGVCTDYTCCQAYIQPSEYIGSLGIEADIEKIRTAVEATAGLVLTYEGKIIDATYFSCSGGRTEDAQVVWGEYIPYLQSVESPGEEASERFYSTVTYTASQFADRLGRSLTGTPGDWLGMRTFTPGGGVATMVIAGERYTGTQLRTLLDLNSTIFVMEAEGDTISITTSGWGHRVGMSQYGADAMAVAGNSWEQILAHYYQGTRIDKIDSLQ